MNLQNIERLQQLLSRVAKNAKLPRTRSQGLVAATAQATAAPAPMTSGVAPVATAPATPAAPAASVVAPAATAPATPAAPAAVTPAAAAPAAAAPAAAAPAAAAPAVVAPIASPLISPMAVVASAAPTVISLPPETAVSLPPETAASLPPESLPTDLLEADDSESLQVLEGDELAIEDVSLDEISGVELQSEPLGDLAIDELDEDDSGVEIGSAVTCEAPVAPDARPATPYTAPPSLDDLTFSEPPPPIPPSSGAIEAPLGSNARNISEAPGSIDAALLAATEGRATLADASEPEVPVLTPPPESGPQISVPPMAAPAIPRAIQSEPTHYRPAAPTIEQLGDVIDLEQDSGPPLELATPIDAEPPRPAEKAGPEELEFVPQAPVPSRPPEGREVMPTLVGGFTEELGSGPHAIDTPPPPARFIVPSVERRPSEPPVSPITAAPQPSFTMPADASFGDEAPTASSMLVPELVARRPIAPGRPVVDVIADARAFRPQSFLELLDASIALMKK